MIEVSNLRLGKAQQKLYEKLKTLIDRCPTVPSITLHKDDYESFRELLSERLKGQPICFKGVLLKKYED